MFNTLLPDGICTFCSKYFPSFPVSVVFFPSFHWYTTVSIPILLVVFNSIVDSSPSIASTEITGFDISFIVVLLFVSFSLYKEYEPVPITQPPNMISPIAKTFVTFAISDDTDFPGIFGFFRFLLSVFVAKI